MGLSQRLRSRELPGPVQLEQPRDGDDTSILLAIRAWGGYEYTSRNEAESVSDIAHTVVRQPIWGFWWD